MKTNICLLVSLFISASAFASPTLLSYSKDSGAILYSTSFDCTISSSKVFETTKMADAPAIKKPARDITWNTQITNTKDLKKAIATAAETKASPQIGFPPDGAGVTSYSAFNKGTEVVLSKKAGTFTLSENSSNAAKILEKFIDSNCNGPKDTMPGASGNN